MKPLLQQLNGQVRKQNTTHRQLWTIVLGMARTKELANKSKQLISTEAQIGESMK